ncbi:MAG: hypothetical protein Q7V20_02615 [Aquabacterium sp.]|uniref:hypothetical protein n=1 Tax=Aquabacterium sp. TaxID=1872578 RepID=UPI002725DB99|nr:hypothetical protein [Aquabacterium sp.]MDO9002331.1 hypothetical protein [Aquabacterium sp.]
MIQRQVRTAWLAASLLLTGGGAAHAVGYTLVDLGWAEFNVNAIAINNANQVVWGSKSAPFGVPSQATIWDGNTGTKTALGPLGGFSVARGISDAGQVVGAVYLSSPGAASDHATVWSGSTVTDLGTVGGRHSAAWGINQSGQVVGITTIGPDPEEWQAPSYAVTWNGGVATVLGQAYSQARGINDAGQVVGLDANANGGGYHATLWNGTTATNLGTLGGRFSEANAINQAGQVVGSAYLSGDEVSHAALWSSGGAITDLGALSGGQRSSALGLNDSGQVVGWSARSDGHKQYATLWDGTQAVDLNSLVGVSPDGFILSTALDINDQGWIVGLRYNYNTGGVPRAFVLIPVPEPGVFALVLAGLFPVGAGAWRRYRQRRLS